ncbi:site-specific DNA-methyltransferase [Micrococcus sp. NPDC055215]
MSEEVHETPSATPNFQTELAAQLAELMPEVIADGKVDVEKLKELLDGDAADTSERFGLFWPGKKRALRAAQEPTTATLRPDFENSKDWDTTKNVFIEGDNLEVLKILQKHYHAKIKMIYIDPPYNTGKDFVYPDNYKEGLDTYLEWTRQVNEEGKKLSTNADTEGRYHSNWLNMMYPRLKLARNLLTDDGVIFISIGEEELPRLRALCDEIFSEAAFISTFVWEKRITRENRKIISGNHDFVVAYAKRAGDFSPVISGLPYTEEALARYRNPDNDPRGPWQSVAMTVQAGHGTSSQFFDVTTPSGRLVELPSGNCWRFSETRFQELREDGRVYFGSAGNGVPRLKLFLSEVDQSLTPHTLWSAAESGTNDSAKRELNDLFGGKAVFETPKPLELLKRIIEIGASDSSALVLDFFAGSGAFADAVMRLNHETGAARRCISVQLPEPTGERSEAQKAGITDIAGIARERLKLSGERMIAESQRRLVASGVPADFGFRGYKLADTNFSKWKVSSDVDRTELEQHLFDLRESSSTDDASADDLLTEILLKQGYSLTEQIASIELAGLDLRSVGDGIVLAYLNEHVKPTLEQLRSVVNEDPARLIVLEDAFQGDDQLKTNLAQLCKSKGIELWTA